jgi:hypothetical protein
MVLSLMERAVTSTPERCLSRMSLDWFVSRPSARPEKPLLVGVRISLNVYVCFLFWL